MVSFQSPILQLNQRKSILELDNNSKKRKWDHYPEADENFPSKQWMNSRAVSTTATATKFFSDIELHLETPLPSDWQRCLDIQSGEIYFYNTRTQKTTVRDPREGPEPASPRNSHMSLDLELNLPCGSLNHNSSSNGPKETTAKLMTTNKSSKTSPSRAPTGDQKKGSDDESKDDETSEMVAAACMKCHMLVVLQKSSPTCPNCKFVHPPYQTPTDLFKSRLSLSC